MAGGEWKEIPISGPAYQNVDEVQLDDLSVVVQNAYVDETNQTVKRPGLVEFVDLSTNARVDGLFWSEKQQTVLAVSRGEVHKITDALGTSSEISSSGNLNKGNPIIFDQDATNIYMTAGANIMYTDLSSLTQMADADAPTTVTHNAFKDTYLLAGGLGDATYQFSDPGTATTWRSTDVFTAEEKEDDLVALIVRSGEIALFGTDSIEFWQNDGVSPFARIGGTTIEEGVIAPYSIAVVDKELTWLNNAREVVTLEKRTPKVIGFPFNKVIQGFSKVSDAIGYSMKIGGLPLYVLTFPDADKTLVYNYLKKDWSEWSYWDSDNGKFTRFRGNAYCYARAWNKHLIGDYKNGKVYEASTSVYGDDGDEIRTLRKTGHISHGTQRDKRCHMISIRVKRGVGNADVASPQMMIRYRDDNKAWSDEILVSLGAIGDDEHLVEISNLGTYRTRQWEISHSDKSEFVLAKMEELVEVLP